MTPKRVVGSARALAAELDVEAVVRRRAHAVSERRVWVRPAPDGMAWMTALLPMAQAVACYAGLKKQADNVKAGGDQRTHAQVMADTLVEWLTGQRHCEDVPVEISVVMSLDALVGCSEQPARFGDGTDCPAQTARDLAFGADAPVWLRRLFTDPVTGEVVTVDRARRRFFTGHDRTTIRARDQHCRHPWCDAPVEHDDHVRPVADGGPTVVANGQGLCAAHNLTKETPGWRYRVVGATPGHHTVQITTPTGHTYTSHAPPALPP